MVVALANLRCSVFVSKKLSQIGSFHEILVLFMGVLGFDFGVRVSKI